MPFTAIFLSFCSLCTGQSGLKELSTMSMKSSPGRTTRVRLFPVWRGSWRCQPLLWGWTLGSKKSMNWSIYQVVFWGAVFVSLWKWSKFITEKSLSYVSLKQNKNNKKQNKTTSLLGNFTNFPMLQVANPNLEVAGRPLKEWGGRGGWGGLTGTSFISPPLVKWLIQNVIVHFYMNKDCYCLDDTT